MSRGYLQFTPVGIYFSGKSQTLCLLPVLFRAELHSTMFNSDSLWKGCLVFKLKVLTF